MAPPPFDQIVTFIYTKDLDAAAEFYGNTLGLPLALDQGPCRIYSAGPAGFLGICNHSKPPEDKQGVIVTLVSSDVDGWADYLAGKGVEFVKPLTFYEEFNIYHFFFRDPDGYLLEIQEFRDPAWPKPIKVPA